MFGIHRGVFDQLLIIQFKFLQEYLIRSISDVFFSSL